MIGLSVQGPTNTMRILRTHHCDSPACRENCQRAKEEWKRQSVGRDEIRARRRDVKGCWGRLSKEQRVVLNLRFALLDDGPLYRVEVADRLGVSVDRVLGIEVAALCLLGLSSELATAGRVR